ncbi:hypothetical protein DRH27_02245 [Candidatus Falkowbacteria bacterium]|nr:MAG: hypothetical protein DRH27_02245 [Candidatus Falkowbacteria bacterium]
MVNVSITLLVVFTSVFFAIIFLLLFIIVAYFKYIRLGMALNRKNKNDYALFFTKVGDEIGFPKLIRKTEGVTHIKGNDSQKSFYWCDDVLKGPKMFGYSWLIYDANDSKVSGGVYYHQTSLKPVGEKFESVPINGTFQYTNPKTGETVTLKNHPYILPLKNSVVNPPNLIRAIIASEALMSMFKEFILKNRYVFYLLIGICGGILLLLFLNYDWLPRKIAEIVIQNCKV